MRQRIGEQCWLNEIHVITQGGGGGAATLTQGGASHDITVRTVVNVDVHRMVLLDLHTTGDRQETTVYHFHLIVSLFGLMTKKGQAVPTTLGFSTKADVECLNQEHKRGARAKPALG